MAVRAAMLPNFQRRGLDCPLLFRNLFTYRVREQHPPNYNYRYIYEYEYNFLNPYPNKYFRKQRLFVAIIVIIYIRRFQLLFRQSLSSLCKKKKKEEKKTW